MFKTLVASLKRLGQLGLILLAVLGSSALSAQEDPNNNLEAIDFRTDGKNNAKIIVELTDPRIAVDIQKAQEGLSIELLNTNVPDDKLYLLDVKDFATNVHQIEVFRESPSTRLVAFVKGEYSFEYTLNGKFLEVSVSEVQEVAKVKEKSLLEREGKKISINFQDIPVRSVLQLIADYNDFNLVVSDSVSGNLTLRLDGVPWQQVLDIILQVKGLDKRVEGNVVLIAPKAELDLQEKEQLEQARLEEELGELVSEIIRVKFANAGEIAAMISGADAMGMLSERGSVTIDDRTNSILIRDLQENVDVVREIVQSLDIPVKQVEIEARIVKVAEGDAKDLGVKWGVMKSNANGERSVGSTINNTLWQSNNLGNFDDVSVNDMLNVNLGAAPTTGTAASIAFQVAKLGKNTLLDLELSALETEEKAEIVSSPKLITTNKKPAFIEQGTEIPYVESTSSGAASVTFKKAVLSLKVTPQITPDNRLVLDLNVTQDAPGKEVVAGNGKAVSIETQRIGTQVLVENGETVVLGGIYYQNVKDTVSKVPLLGDIPLLGHLFKNTGKKYEKSELLIFVTPRVINP